MAAHVKGAVKAKSRKYKEVCKIKAGTIRLFVFEKCLYPLKWCV
ncbi:hypothetical protein CHK_1006 [Christensenella hongkongensis]|uniref:Uncharacterized protein n=1 Tax=Christensenella hongkongensis TaxID=270498 RepID=A0A0M2NG66_9FIRM|nr:hypothetical protein CHK_1006 [Christensenella hongkongensis]